MMPEGGVSRANLHQSCYDANVTRGSTQRTFKTCYFPSGQRKTRTRLNGSDTAADCDTYTPSSLRARDTYAYAGDGLVSSKTRKRRDETTKTQDYDYDINANRTTDERGTHAFDSRDHLVRWTRGSGKRNAGTAVDYTVNGAGAVTTKQDGAPAADDGGSYDFTVLGDRIEKMLYTPAGGGTSSTATYTNDVFGNVTQIAQTGLGTTTYSYDEFERLTEAKGAGEDKPARYEYDGLDRRDTKCSGYSGPASATTNCPAGNKQDFSYIGTSESLSREAPIAGSGHTRSYDYDSGMERLRNPPSPTGVRSKPLSTRFARANWSAAWIIYRRART